MKKYFAVGVIFLFFGTCLFPATAQDNEKPLSSPRGNWLYVGGSGPGNYTKIRYALENASTNDTIFVYDDHAPYYEHYLIILKPLHLIGENQATTVIDSCKGLTIFIIQANYVSISGFTLINSSGSGIELESACFCTISNNTVRSASDTGILLWGNCNYNLIKNNTVTSSGFGVYLYWYCVHNIISWNTVNNTGHGITIGGPESNYNYVLNNSCGHHNWGIELYQSAYYNTVADNTCDGGGSRDWFGIILDAGANMLYRNTIRGYNYGIYLQDFGYDNIFSRNSMIECLTDVKDPETNIWNLGSPGTGNYYCSYYGSDVNQDGIGDNPYSIPGGANIDQYPFINPYGSIKNIDNDIIFYTIQTAIDNPGTSNGNHIHLQRFTFHESVNLTKTLSLSGDFRGGTFLDGSSNGTILRITADAVYINNLTIQNSGVEMEDCGIHVLSNAVQICNVTIQNCSTGILLAGENNNVYHNSFLDNQQNAWSMESNQWDYGAQTGGNYWDDYNGTDINNDGIGDTPYPIPPGTNADHYPFMNRNGWRNHPPLCPIITGISIGAVNHSYNFSMVATDPDGDAIAYNISWGDQTWTGWTSLSPSGSPIVLNHAWTAPGTYLLTGIARDAYHVCCIGETILTVHIIKDNSPQRPTITGPKRGTVGEPCKYTFQTIDPDGDSIEYWIDWGDGTLTGWISSYPSGQSISVNHTWFEKKSYQIMVKARDSLQMESEWGTLTVHMPLNKNLVFNTLRLMRTLLHNLIQWLFAHNLWLRYNP